MNYHNPIQETWLPQFGFQLSALFVSWEIQIKTWLSMVGEREIEREFLALAEGG